VVRGAVVTGACFTRAGIGAGTDTAVGDGKTGTVTVTVTGALSARGPSDPPLLLQAPLMAMIARTTAAVIVLPFTGTGPT
jgi:hypothetical protein